MPYLFSNILGNFVLDKSFSIIKAGEEEELRKEFSDLKEVPKEDLPKVLCLFKDAKYYVELREKNTKLTRKAIKDSVNEDNLITQSVANYAELDRTINLLTKRLREWYALYFPELVQRVEKHEKFVELVIHNGLSHRDDDMGFDLEKKDLSEIILLAKQIQNIYELREKHEEYLEKIMQSYCPNLLSLAGVTIGAKLLELGKGLKHLAMLPSSTIQLLGAEKALFRHLRTGSKSPKYGIIFQHQLLQNAKKSLRGKAARMLADKLSICCRIDYFKGEFRAEQYKKELEEKFE